MNILLLTFLASLFYLIPTVLGTALLFVTKYRKQEPHLSTLPISFLLGTGLIFGIALFIQYLLLPAVPNISFSQLFFPTIYSLFGISVIGLGWKAKKLKPLFSQHMLRVGLLSLGLSAISYFIWTWKSPYSLNWDLYEHQTLVHLITQGHFSYFTSQISDTFGFNSYPPVFHLLMALSQFPITLNPEQILQYWNVIGFFHLWLVSLISYAFAYTVTRNKSFSLLSCIVGTLTFESVIAFTSFFLLPQTVAAVLFISLFTHFIWRKKNSLSLLSIEVFLSILLLISLHYVMGGVAFVILLATIIYFSAQDKIDKLTQKVPLIEIFIMAMVGGLFLTQFINLGSLNHGEAASYIFTLSDKIKFMAQSYGLLFIFALPLGIFAMIRQHSWLKKYLLLILFGFLVILCAQLPYVLKFYVLARWFVLFFATAGIWSLIEKQSFSFSRKMSFIIVSLLLSGILILNSLLWKQGLGTDQQISHVSQDELAAAQYLQSNYSQDSVLLISDPATQYILEGLSGINSAGGSFANAETRVLLSQALKENNSTQVATQLRQIRDAIAQNKRVFVVFSGRLFLWEKASDTQKLSFDFNIWESRKLKFSDDQWLATLDQAHFTPIYQNDSLQIKELH